MLRRWKWHVNSLVLELVSSDRQILEAEATLAKYEKMERLSLLELAVWKANRNSSDHNKDKLALDERRITSGVQENLFPWSWRSLEKSGRVTVTCVS